MSTTPSRFGFHGREKELAWLRSHFDAVAARAADGKFAGPRMAFIVAESGIGKSRLVQELYLHLTNDPQWDPPEVNYWPDTFREVGAQLRTVPDMRGHVPAGPPRFAWLGARWQPTDVRNVSERRSVLPEIRSSVTTHAEVLKSHGSAWADAAGRVGEVFRDEGVGAAADAIGIPFFGLLTKVAKSVKDMATDRLAGPKSFDRVESEEIKSEIDEVLDCMRLLLDGRGAVPTVLWLDDAQWTDAETLEFVRKLWDQAQRRRWPLLLAVTHWEREWRELAQVRRMGDAAPSLVDFEGQPSVDTLHLANAANDALRDYLAQRLPGLTPEQQRLLVDKAGGNFLTMVENTGELLSEPMWFVGERIDGALTDDAVAHIVEFETDRERRVEQRFKALEVEVKKLLGWSTQMGSRFLADVVLEFAREKSPQVDPGHVLEKCVDPYAVLGRPSPYTREFRDKVFHHVAREHFQKFLKGDAARLSAVLRRHLVEWINNSFDAEGNEIWPSAKRGISAPDRSASGLTDEERRDLLGMALKELPLPEKPDWTNAEDVAAFRAVYLLVITEWRDDLWIRVSELVRSLEGWPFAEMPGAVLSVDNLDWMFDTARTAGAFRVAGRIAEAVLAERSRLVAEEETADRLLDLSVSLNNIGNILEARGDTQGALERYEESLGIEQRLVELEETSDRLWGLSASLDHIGKILEFRGDTQGALERYEESLEIRQRLVELEETPGRLRGLSVSLNNIGNILRARGDTQGALERYEESLGIAQRLVELEETPGRLRDLSVSLDYVGWILEFRGDTQGALERYEKSLGIRQRLVETPNRLEDLSVSLDNVGRVLEARGDTQGALERYEESLGIRQRLVELEETPGRLRGLGASLEYVGWILEARGDTQGALERYEESLGIAQRLVELEETPGRLDDLSVSLNHVGKILEARGDTQGALERYEESLGIRQRLLELEETPGRLRDLGVSLDNVGDILKVRGDTQGALERYEESLRIVQGLLKLEVTQETQNGSLWDAHLTASCLVDLSRPGEALALLDELSSTAAELESACDDDLNILDTCAAFHETYAKASAALGRIDEAQRRSEHGAAIRARIAELKDGAER